MNKYQELINDIMAIIKSKRLEIDSQNAQIIYHIASYESLEKDIQNIAADREELEGIKNTKENYRSLIHRNIIGDIKVSAIYSLISGLSLSTLPIIISISPLIILISLIIFCLISGIKVALDPNINYINEINKNYDLAELNASIDEKKKEEQEFSNQKSCILTKQESYKKVENKN